MITGFLVFSKPRTLLQIFKTVVTRLMLPLAVTIILLQLLHPFLSHQGHSLGALDFKSIIRSFALLWDEPIRPVQGFYLWYIYALIVVYFWYPLLALLCTRSREADTARRYVLSLSLLAVILYPTSVNIFPALKGLFLIPSPITMYSIFYVMIGYEMKLVSRRVSSRKYPWLPFLVLYLFGTWLNYALTVRYELNIDGIFKHLFFAYDSIGVMLSSIGLFGFMLLIPIRSTAVQRCLNFVGDRTFVIYLIHWPIVYKLNSMGIAAQLKAGLPIFFYPVYIALCFLIALTAATALYFCKKLLLEYIPFNIR